MSWQGEYDGDDYDYKIMRDQKLTARKAHECDEARSGSSTG